MGTGGKCGAAYLSRNFENFIRMRLGDRGRSILTPLMMKSALKSFEGSIKFEFDPFSPDSEAYYEIPLRGAPDIKDIGLVQGYLKISRYVYVLTKG